MKKETVRRYSLAFKQQVVREYEAGASIYKLRDKYGVGSQTSIGSRAASRVRLSVRLTQYHAK